MKDFVAVSESRLRPGRRGQAVLGQLEALPGERIVGIHLQQAAHVAQLGAVVAGGAFQESQEGEGAPALVEGAGQDEGLLR
jgi:hypothetical protein